MPSSSPAYEGTIRENDVNEVAVTAQIKKFLKLHIINGRDAEATGDDSSEGADTPRFPLKRAASGRFPIKVNGTDVPDMRSPSLGSRPPPFRRGHIIEGSRSKTLLPGDLDNSESLLRSERSESRQRRMGMLPKKSASDLSTLDEMEANNRFSHYRGLSHGSAMQGAPVPAKSPQTPTADSSMQRPIYVRRLSVLPERRRESKIFDPVIEAAKGILYSVFQIHPMIQMLMTLTNDGSSKRSSLELVFYNTNSHVEELEQEIQKHDTTVYEYDELPSKDNANVHRACQTLVGAYGHVCTLLADNIDTFVSNGDARYIRTLLMLIYNSIMELRVTLSSVSAQHKKSSPSESGSHENSDTIKPYFKEASTIASGVHRPVGSRGRNGTIVHNPLKPGSDPYGNGPNRGPRSVPRSNESNTPPMSRDIHANFSEEDAQFDRIFLSLQNSTDIVSHILPNFSIQLTGGVRNATQQRAPAGLLRDWRSLIALCNETIQQTEILKNRLSLIKLKDPGVRTQASFWTLCNNFVASWTKMASKIKAEINTIPLPPDTRVRLRPIHQSMKETITVILQSPWHHLFQPSGPTGAPAGPFGQNMSPNQMSITPQSAALGPAMQATVATPQTGSFAAVFQGNVFDRADTLMANPGISMPRNGTMTRGHSGFGSLSSISSMSSDGVPTPSSAFSPSVQLGPAPFRLNGGKTDHLLNRLVHLPRHLSTPSTSAASAQAITAHASSSSNSNNTPLQPTLPSAETQRHIAQARAAVVASMGNMLDSELQSRAQMLHDNAGALGRQERDVLRATEGLRRETDRLAREADGAAKKLKEVGNVQNWAEVLERGFLVLEETVSVGDEDMMDLDGVEEGIDDVLSDGEGAGSGWSDASRSLMDAGSSTTGRAKGSETASVSTT
ncbi:hypothetical protein PT974_00353 [Cladobotryum mycophilum]|uniref:Biogenesis of lysosome-related organelles complex 1 subunit 1 n=1 Tax=Cladobotryum mycophilum TaxID=491253 RepID=A0ABR0T181_9HYPO